MKFIDLTEGEKKQKKQKKRKVAKPRAQRLNKLLMSKKAASGAMRSEKDYSRAKEKEKLRKEMNEADEFGGMDPRELYRDVRQQIREAGNHLNFILAKYYDRGPRYEKPDRDTLHRLARAASMIENANHMLAAGTPDDKQDPMDV